MDERINRFINQIEPSPTFKEELREKKQALVSLSSPFKSYLIDGVISSVVGREGVISSVVGREEKSRQSIRYNFVVEMYINNS